MVERLARTLSAYGIQVWLDREQLRPGERWAAAIQHAIEAGAFYIACFSTQYAMRSRTYMNEELTVAIDELRLRPTNRAWFVPVLLDDCDVPDRSIGAGETLRSLQWLKLHENWEQGVARLLAVIQPGSERIHELATELDSPSARARITALDHVATLGGQAALLAPKAMEQLEHPNQTVRRAAIDALVRVVGPTEELIRALLRLIVTRGQFAGNYVVSDEFPYDAHSAEMALAAFGEPALELLLRLAHGDSQCAGVVSGILRKERDPRAAPRLTLELGHTSPEVRASSACGLGQIFGPKGSHSLNDKLPIRSVESPHLALLQQIGAVAALTHAVRDVEPLVRVQAALALGRIGTLARAAVPELIEALSDAEADVRAAVAGALANIGAMPDEVIPKLVDLLGQEPYVATAAAVALGSLGQRALDATPLLIANANRINPYQLFQALGEIGDPRGIPVLVRGLTHAQGVFRQLAEKELQKLRASGRS